MSKVSSASVDRFIKSGLPVSTVKEDIVIGEMSIKQGDSVWLFAAHPEGGEMEYRAVFQDGQVVTIPEEYIGKFKSKTQKQ